MLCISIHVCIQSESLRTADTHFPSLNLHARHLGAMPAQSPLYTVISKWGIVAWPSPSIAVLLCVQIQPLEGVSACINICVHVSEEGEPEVSRGSYTSEARLHEVSPKEQQMSSLCKGKSSAFLVLFFYSRPSLKTKGVPKMQPFLCSQMFRMLW